MSRVWDKPAKVPYFCVGDQEGNVFQSLVKGIEGQIIVRDLAPRELAFLEQTADNSVFTRLQGSAGQSSVQTGAPPFVIQGKILILSSEESSGSSGNLLTRSRKRAADKGDGGEREKEPVWSTGRWKIAGKKKSFGHQYIQVFESAPVGQRTGGGIGTLVLN